MTVAVIMNMDELSVREKVWGVGISGGVGDVFLAVIGREKVWGVGIFGGVGDTFLAVIGREKVRSWNLWGVGDMFLAGRKCAELEFVGEQETHFWQ